jgi:hypothetical protein
MDNTELLDKILSNQKNDTVVYMTEAGLMGSTVSELLNQPSEGVLYDLNRDIATLVTLGRESKNKRWINDIALAFVFTELHKKYVDLETKFNEVKQTNESLIKANNTLNTYVSELEAYIDKLNVKPIKEKITTDLNNQPVHTPINSSAKTTSIFHPVEGTITI